MAERKYNVFDKFVIGANKGFHIGTTSMLPNVVMAFVITAFLNITGLTDVISTVFAPFMALFGVPGIGMTVIIGSFLSMGSGIGISVALHAAGSLTSEHVVIMAPASLLFGALVQYMGRCLGTSGVPAKHYPIFFVLCFLNACISMLIMNILV